MATTGFWPIKSNLLALIKYTENPKKTSSLSENDLKALHDVLDYDMNGDKTEQKLYVTGINCLFETAYERMMATKKQFAKTGGVLSPIIVRPKENTVDEYEIVSGHRRFRSVQKLGYETIPAFIYNLDRDTAAVAVVDSNLHRERLFPSEKAFAYKMKLDALKHQGKATDETSRQLVGKLETADIISETDSGRQVQRYIRLTNLIPPLLRYVDEGKIALTPAVALSYLYPDEQEILMEAMEYHDCTPSLSQALYLKGISQAGVCCENEIYKVLAEEKANQKEKVKIPIERLQKYFPRSYTAAQMEDAIIRILNARQKARENKGGDAR